MEALRAPAPAQPAAVEEALGVSVAGMVAVAPTMSVRVATLENELAHASDAHP